MVLIECWKNDLKIFVLLGNLMNNKSRKLLLIFKFLNIILLIKTIDKQF